MCNNNRVELIKKNNIVVENEKIFNILGCGYFDYLIFFMLFYFENVLYIVLFIYL